MDAIDELLKALNILNAAKHGLDPHFIKDVIQLSTTMMEGLTETSGEFLQKLDEKETSEKALKKMIDACPKALSLKRDNLLPVEIAAMDVKSVQYVPILAREGARYNVGGSDGHRGGLRLPHAFKQVLTNSEMNNRAYLAMIKQLKKEGILRKEDIRKHNLLSYAYNAEPPAKCIFEFLASIDPQSLKECIPIDVYNDDNGFIPTPQFHEIIWSALTTDSAQMFLSTALKYYPTEIGLLFQKNDDTRTAFHCALEMFGEKETFDMIQRCIPLDEAGTMPILHRAAEHAPDYFNEFAKRYPSSFFVRDENGRDMQQTMLASGHKSYSKDAWFYLHITDTQVRQRDPGNGLYPFMVAACNITNDLEGTYYLLRRNPSLVSHGFDHSIDDKTKLQKEKVEETT